MVPNVERDIFQDSDGFRESEKTDSGENMLDPYAVVAEKVADESRRQYALEKAATLYHYQSPFGVITAADKFVAYLRDGTVPEPASPEPASPEASPAAQAAPDTLPAVPYLDHD